MFYKVIPVLRSLADTGIPRDLNLCHTEHDSSLNMLQQRQGKELEARPCLYRQADWRSIVFRCVTKMDRHNRKTYRNLYIDFKLAPNKMSNIVNTSTNKLK